MGHIPSYNFDDFKEACKRKEVFPIFNVLSDAEKIFNLRNIDAIQEFIENDGLEKLKFINSTEFKLNKYDIVIMVDAYEFMTLDIKGYIAFMFNPIKKNWIIKSFHRSETSNTTLEEALHKAGITPNTFQKIEDK